jgi:hypothetical protein
MSMTRRAELGSSEAIGSSAITSSAPLDERARDRRALLLPTGELAPPLERVDGDADAVERLHGTTLVGLAEAADRALQERHAAEQAEAHIGEHRQSRHQVELLEDDADACPQLFRGAANAAVTLHRLPKKDDFARPVRRIGRGSGRPAIGPVDRNEAGDRPDQG